MKRITNNTYPYLLMVITAISAIACSDDTDDLTTDRGVRLELTSYLNDLVPSPTRGVPTAPEGYSAFVVAEGQSVASLQVGAFMPAKTSEVGLDKLTGRLSYKAPESEGGKGRWSGRFDVSAGDYYVFGYMPANAGTATLALSAGETDYSKGATITIDGVSPISANDICALSGFANSNETLALGSYTFTIPSGLGEDATVPASMLLDHLYSHIPVNIYMSEEYHKLRHIKLKSMVLTTDVKKGVLTVVMGTSGVKSATFVPGGKDSPSVGLRLAVDSLTTSQVPLTSFYCPKEISSFTLTTTYDVYDTKYDKVIRANCVSANKIEMAQTFDRGVSYPLNIRVAPTYLYKLTAADLDNPNFEITE